MRIALQQAYVLHTRAYRDSSLLVELFSREHGRVSMVARGAKSKGRKSPGGSVAAMLQPFAPLLCSWSGRTELHTCTGCESQGPARPLHGKRIYCGLYVNELLNRLLHHEDPHQELFDYYEDVLEQLASSAELDLVLRQFEFRLLDVLGYGFDLQLDGLSGDTVEADGWYVFHPEYGLVRAQAEAGSAIPRFSGKDLLHISKGIFEEDSRKCAKRLMRTALAAHLGEKPLKSRELFVTMQ